MATHDNQSSQQDSEPQAKSGRRNVPRFDPASFEAEMREAWQRENVSATSPAGSEKEKSYVLAMFPYPSGDGLHTGHARIYTGTDVLARYLRMSGKAVLHPMGWDAFGLPAENSAIKKKTNPQSLVPQNIENFKRQFKKLGISYDWDKEINTTDPNYYAITQQLFITFFKHGLLYKKETPVYYCPFCKTGIAQEEVEEDGTHERCGTVVEKRSLPQWIFRIQEYADSLLQGLEKLDWPSGILEMQRNWIGKKEGLTIEYPVVDANGNETGQTIACFTTKPETNFGATFIVLAPEHPFVESLLSGKTESANEALLQGVREYVEAALRKTERERQAEEKNKTGVFTGHYAVNRLNGKKLPVWVSDFVLVNVGTAAVVGVPAHDKRDYLFAATFDLPIERVVEGPGGDRSEISEIAHVHEDDGIIFSSGKFDTMGSLEAREEISTHIVEKGWGSRGVTYHLRDWIFSRQRYWGEPIPMVYCQSCAEKGTHFWNSSLAFDADLRLKNGPENKTFGDMVEDIQITMVGWFPLDQADLPLKLPMVDSYEPTESGASPLSALTEWMHAKCPVCGEDAKRETDTMPNWAGSCWYFLAYPMAPEIRSGSVDPKNPFTDAVQGYMPVDWYIGGAEHAVLHLLYARFWMHVLNDLGSVSSREPFTRLRNVGMVHAHDGKKMSKSHGNVVNPDDVIAEYGADALRVYEMFMAPFAQQVDWSTQTLQGSYRFLRRVWQTYHASDKITKARSDASTELVAELQRLIQKVSSDITNVKFNTPIASMMEFLNAWEMHGMRLDKASAEAYLKLLAPYAPYVTDRIWRGVFGNVESIHIQEWPVPDESLTHVSHIIIPVQVDGKVRGNISVVSGIGQENVEEAAKSLSSVSKWLVDKKYEVFFVQDRVINFRTK